MADVQAEVVVPEIPDAPVSATPEPGSTADPVDRPDESGQAPEAKKPERTFSQKELDEIVTKARAKESRRAERIAYERARREIAEAELQRLRSGGDKQEPQKARAAGERPRAEDFTDYDAYLEAFADWKIDQRTKQATEQYEKRVTGQREQEYAQTVRQKMALGSEKYEDFDDVIGAPGVAFTDVMVDALLATDLPHEVAYNLAQNPSETQRIAGLSVAQQVLEINRFAASLNKPPAPTKAPEPIKPGKSEGSVSVTPETAQSYEDFVKARNRQLGRV